MAWSYTGNPGASAKDQLRFLIGDTDECDQLLQDGELTWLLTQYNNTPMNAAIRACEILMMKFGRLVDESVGSVSLSYSQRVAAFTKLQVMLRNRLATEDCSWFAGGISISQEITVNANTDRVRPAFTRDMMDNWQLSPWIQGTGSPGFWWGN